MNILLLGYGKMGRAIEAIAIERGHNIVGKINENNLNDIKKHNSTNTDVAIEFSQPDAAFDNIKYCIDNGIPALSGTTGWLDKKANIETLCKQKEGTFFYASNYSIGVNLFFKLNEQLATLMKAFDEYNVDIEEIHHTEKKDAPSGTAITLAEGILKHATGKKQWINKPYGSKEDLVINSIREDKVPGTHTIKYSSAVDDIEIKHTAHSREGFAKGAVMVAEWLKDKKGILDMKDFLKL
ncbi:4-hydroxy-tetrahydrodipicolinate reductase [Fulvivirga kasyanovii]|uniref:4-hydroxy-tetrahydrodipicolinate reductase n=1 Tax=Fulvivirga kasyanovii TaxID=396812 RepID=A0ABW9S014_9BACT|nr:4-hydroxy-tetrahydrodipicolinate reductase [Fulvivirga kasyanovii]MTI28923.1 4-hydroxy-tetrahydrodipicolinate reductase [Fulvivirga kasyanovii]